VSSLENPWSRGLFFPRGGGPPPAGLVAFNKAQGNPVESRD